MNDGQLLRFTREAVQRGKTLEQVDAAVLGMEMGQVIGQAMGRVHRAAIMKDAPLCLDAAEELLGQARHAIFEALGCPLTFDYDSEFCCACTWNRPCNDKDTGDEG